MKKSRIIAVLGIGIIMVTVLGGCYGDIEYAPLDHQIKEMEATFNSTVVLDTSTMDEREQSEIINAVNNHLEDAEIMTNVRHASNVDGGHWIFEMTTDDDRELKIVDSYANIKGETKSAGAVSLDGERIGFLDKETYNGFKASFDADQYTPYRS